MSIPLYIYIYYIIMVWFAFMAYQTLSVIKCQIPFIHIYQIYKIWFCEVLWHINHCRLFDAKSFLCIQLNIYDL